jgi:hypothetical protein
MERVNEVIVDVVNPVLGVVTVIKKLVYSPQAKE